MSSATIPERVRPVWLASYPRSGNTFLRIVLQNLFRLASYSVYRLEGESFPDPSAEPLEDAPTLPRNWRERLTDDPEAQPVLIKTHGGVEPLGQAVYVIREGRATVDSYFHYHSKFSFEQRTLTDVIAGACQFGGWSDHYQSWQPQTRPRTLLLRYEELVAQPERAVEQLADFLKLAPVEARLPSFEELNRRWPDFFRRGKDRSDLRGWTESQQALYELLHGAVARELGYPAEPVSGLAPGTTLELARSAANSHKLYLETLVKLGANARATLSLGEEVARLESEQAQLRKSQRSDQAQIAQLEQAMAQLTENSWVRLGKRLRLIRAPAGRKSTPQLKPGKPEQSLSPL